MSSEQGPKPPSPSPSNTDRYVTLEDAAREVGLTVQQLKRLVSEGEIRAIRGEQNVMKFRREEVDRLKQYLASLTSLHSFDDALVESGGAARAKTAPSAIVPPTSVKGTTTSDEDPPEPTQKARPAAAKERCDRLHFSTGWAYIFLLLGFVVGVMVGLATK